MADDNFQRPVPRSAGNPPYRSPALERDIDVRQPDTGLSTVIPYKNPLALTSYYFGVFSLIPCLALLLGPAALVLRILGLQYLARNPTAKGVVHAWIGICAGLLTLVSNAAVLLFFLLASPATRSEAFLWLFGT